MDKIYPFKFLDSYGQDDKEVFFGRKAEIDALYEMVFQTSILMVYGASGTGKTSLIQCGLAGRFKSHDWLAIYVRRGDNLNRSLDKALAENGANEKIPDFDIFNTTKTAAPVAELTPLAKSFKAIYLKNFRPIYLIFDQFEELFVIGDKTEQEEFINTVQEILRLDQPVKMIFSMREEYLGNLFEFEKSVPQLMRKKLRVEPMSIDKVREVINGIAALKETSYVTIKAGDEGPITESIFHKIKDKDKSLTIQLPYLQVFLDKLYRSNTDEIKPEGVQYIDTEFTNEAITKMGNIGDILRDFLDEQVASASSKLSKSGSQTSEDDIWDILSPLVTFDGTKKPMSMAALQKELPKTEKPVLVAVIKQFKDNRLLRHTEEGDIYELAHDALAGQIAKKRSVDEKALIEVRRILTMQISLNQAGSNNGMPELLSKARMDIINPYKDKITDPDELALINASNKAIQKQKEDALAEELEKKKKSRQLIAGLAIILSVMTVSFVFSISKYVEANHDKLLADTATAKAKYAETNATKKEAETKETLKALVKQTAISKAKEKESYGDSYQDNGNNDYALQIYKEALDSIKAYSDDSLYKQIERKKNELTVTTTQRSSQKRKP